MDSENAHQGTGNKLFYQVWIWLLLLTVIEVVLAYQHLGVVLMLVILVGLSVMKAALIIAYFMHLRFERMSLFLTLIPVLVFMICLMFITFPDSLRIRQLVPL